MWSTRFWKQKNPVNIISQRSIVTSTNSCKLKLYTIFWDHCNNTKIKQITGTVLIHGVWSILPSQEPTFSPSGLPTELPMITPSTTPSRDPTQSPSNKPSWLSIFHQVKIPERNHHIALVQLPLCWKSWSPVENQVIFLLNNQVEYQPCPLLQCQEINLLAFQVVAQVISLATAH